MSEISGKGFHSFIIRFHMTTLRALLVLKIQRYNVRECENGKLKLRLSSVVKFQLFILNYCLDNL